jgi:3-oxoacyl-[acyl-carrier-protein] synthase-3
MTSKIIGSGSYIPSQVVTNLDFAKHNFFHEDGRVFDQPNEVIAQKFLEITGISERRYVEDNQTASDIGVIAAQKAIADAKIDPETLDYIIVAHNFGDVKSRANQSDILPSLASRIKHHLRIKNPACVAYDILFGCPGWIEGVIQANAFIKAGMAKRCLVIGTETLSRVVDRHDRDSMIYADGAGATIIEASTEEGLVSFATVSHTYDEAFYLYFGNSNNKACPADERYIKMQGRKIYEYALSQVPKAMASCLEKSQVGIDQIKKILIHQANEKMDEAIIQRFYKLHHRPVPKDIMPMSIHEFGNSSVATIPTLYDLIIKNQMKAHTLNPGDYILFASVGAGMNINAMVYKL